MVVLEKVQKRADVRVSIDYFTLLPKVIDLRITS